MSIIYSEIQKVINELQESAKLAYGSHAGHAWANGFLGSTLVDVLYSHLPATKADIIMENLKLYTKRNLEKESA